MEEKRVPIAARPEKDRTTKDKKLLDPVPNKPEIKSVVKSAASVKKKGPVKRFFSQIFADDVEDIKTSIVMDTLLPAIRDMIFDAVMGGLSIALFGDTYRSSKYRKGSNHIDYGKISTGIKHTVNRTISQRSELSSSMDDLIFEYREDAVSVLDGIMDQMEQYESVSVADVYILAGIPSTITDNNYGWDNPGDLSKIKIVRIGGAWSLKLPRPYPID